MLPAGGGPLNTVPTMGSPSTSTPRWVPGFTFPAGKEVCGVQAGSQRIAIAYLPQFRIAAGFFVIRIGARREWRPSLPPNPLWTQSGIPHPPLAQHTEHTMLAGEGATKFAKMMGLQEEDLGTDDSHKDYRAWTESSCQPNYYRDFIGAGSSCPPYDTPTSLEQQEKEAFPQVGRSEDPARLLISENNHDTIGIIVVDELGDLACGTTTNGAANKIAGRIGDSPVAGAGCYVDNDVGGAAATGDGDVMMR